jgi:hypothetical protein
VQQQVANATGKPLSEAQVAELDFAAQLSGSCTHKARLLHYFPVDQQQQEQQQQRGQDEDWCGWHLDHGSLTGGQAGRRAGLLLVMVLQLVLTSITRQAGCTGNNSS